MTNTTIDWRQLSIFAAFILILTAGGYTGLALTGDTNILLLAAPALAALATKLITQRNLRGLLWGLPKPIWLPIGYVIPIVVSGTAFAIYWLVLDGFGSEEGTPFLPALGITSSVAFLAIAAFAIGEELGWRGFLVPELAKSMRFGKVALITGLNWTIWHWPLILLSSSVTGLNSVPQWYALPIFTVILTAAGTVLAFVTLRSQSVWPAVVLHGAQNAFTHEFFLNFTRQNGTSAYLVSETGAFLAITWSIAALVALRAGHSDREA